MGMPLLPELPKLRVSSSRRRDMGRRMAYIIPCTVREVKASSRDLPEPGNLECGDRAMCGSTKDRQGVT